MWLWAGLIAFGGVLASLYASRLTMILLAVWVVLTVRADLRRAAPRSVRAGEEAAEPAGVSASGPDLVLVFTSVRGSTPDPSSPATRSAADMTTAPVTNRLRPEARAGHSAEVRTAVAAALLVGLLAVLTGALVGGSPAALGAAVGSGMVLVFFGFGALTVNAVASVSPAASLLVALLTYTLEVVAVGVVFVP